MRRFTSVTALLAVLVVLVGGLATASRSTAHAEVQPVAAKAAAKAPDDYTPRAGVKVNNPLGRFDERRVILRHLLRTIDSTKARSKVRIATWNLRSDAVVRALSRAHRRGVSVRVIIDAGNANAENPNEGFARLKEVLGDNPKWRPRERRSWARRCKGSCRGPSGIAHTKMFLFSKAGKAKHITMFGSANATDLAAGYQWNDMFTLVERRGIYRQLLGVFHEMSKDRRAKRPYRVWHNGRHTTEVFPYIGAGTKRDPVLRELGRVRCDGARGGTGTRGRTKIRIAMTSWHGDRGIAIAERVRRLYNRGCDIRIIYAVMGNNVLDIVRSRLGRGPIPLRQIAQDWNDDGVYDRYLHMKVLTVSGRYAGDRSATVTWNGSSNWSPVSLASDEVGMRITRPGVLERYNSWVEWLFAHPPVQSRESARRMAMPGVDPYAKIQVN